MDTLVHPSPITFLSDLSLKGKCVAMVTFSPFPADPRPRRAVEALLREGMSVELICLQDGNMPRREKRDRLDITRLPIKNRRGGFLSYLYQYSSFLIISASMLAARSVMRPFDLVYVHNMPDILVVSAVIPKARGAKVILDMHDPMPELMTTIFGLKDDSFPIRILRRLEKWSMALSDSVLTVNIACKRIFASRSCRPEKIGIIMNSPDDELFPFRAPRSRPEAGALDERFVIMYHGSIVERNGLDLAIEALAKIRHIVPGAELRIYGRATPFLERVLDEAHKKGLKDCVTYLGPKRLEDLVREIEQSDVGIIPNQRNAFTDINTPTRVFEYLVLGKPVIAPRTQGITDYFNPTSLFYFMAGNSDDLARAICHVYSHPTEALTAVERGQQIYLAHKWSAERQNLVNVVRELLQGAARPTSQTPR
jgi:glycosyltransferase involved in cell wall biosynthesis